MINCIDVQRTTDGLNDSRARGLNDSRGLKDLMTLGTSHLGTMPITIKLKQLKVSKASNLPVVIICCNS